MVSSRTHAEHKVWLVDSSAYFHMNPHKEWFCVYEICRGDVFLGDDLADIIIGQEKIKLKLMDGRIKTILGVLHILGLTRNLIFVSMMSHACLKTVFVKETCRMV